MNKYSVEIKVSARKELDALSALTYRIHDGISLLLKMLNFVKDALKIEEDRALASLAKDREQTLDRKKALTDGQAWAPLKQSRQ